MNNSTILYLNIGKRTFEIKYFESVEYWGGYEPRQRNCKFKIIIKITDTYKKQYTKTFWIHLISIEEAQKFNSKIGMPIDSDLKYNQQTTPQEMQTENI